MSCSSHSSNFIFHATDPETNEIVDFDEFFVRLQGSDGSLSAEADLVARLGSVCTVEKITVSTNSYATCTFSVIVTFDMSSVTPLHTGICQH